MAEKNSSQGKQSAMDKNCGGMESLNLLTLPFNQEKHP